jgi:hypothetical protein
MEGGGRLSGAARSQRKQESCAKAKVFTTSRLSPSLMRMEWEDAERKEERTRGEFWEGV